MKLIYEYEISAGHRIMNYEGKCRYLHGHNYLFQIELETKDLDERGFVVDFNEIKSILKELDHKVILNANDPLADVLEEHAQPVVRLEGNPSAENIAIWVAKEIASHLEGRVRYVKVRVWESRNSSVEHTLVFH